jgi:hypothetical protein
MERLKRHRKIAAAAAGAFAVVALVPSGAALAKISPPACVNGGGQTPPGQQPVCTGGGLTQTPALNPAGHAPPGQQP